MNSFYPFVGTRRLCSVLLSCALAFNNPAGGTGDDVHLQTLSRYTDRQALVPKLVMGWKRVSEPLKLIISKTRRLTSRSGDNPSTLLPPSLPLSGAAFEGMETVSMGHPSIAGTVTASSSESSGKPHGLGSQSGEGAATFPEKVGSFETSFLGRKRNPVRQISSWSFPQRLFETAKPGEKVALYEKKLAKLGPYMTVEVLTTGAFGQLVLAVNRNDWRWRLLNAAHRGIRGRDIDPAQWRRWRWWYEPAVIKSLRIPPGPNLAQVRSALPSRNSKILLPEAVALERLSQVALWHRLLGVAPELYEVIQDQEGTFHLVMEHLHRYHRLGEVVNVPVEDTNPLEAVADPMIAVLRAVERALRAGLIHGDLKPSNIMIREYAWWLQPFFGRYRVKIIDWGAVSLVREAGKEIPLEVSNSFSPAYAAPEQMGGEKRVYPDVRADVHALAVTAFDLLVGHIRFKEIVASKILTTLRQSGSLEMLKPEVQKLRAVIRQTRMKLKLPIGFLKWIETSMSFHAAGRFKNVELMIESLTQWLQHPEPWRRPDTLAAAA